MAIMPTLIGRCGFKSDEELSVRRPVRLQTVCAGDNLLQNVRRPDA
jgi:hypothetical protein